MNVRFQTILFFLVPQIILLSFPYVTADLGFWVALGRDMIEQGKIITHDTYSILETKPMIYPSWGISILYALIDKIGGLELLFIFHRLIFFLFQYLIYIKIKAAKLSDSKLSLILLLSLIGASFYCDRPAMIPIIYFVIIHDLTKELSRKLTFQKALCFLGIIIAWTNTHGSVLFNYIYLSMIILYDISINKFEIKKTNYFVIFSLIFLGTLINPFGFQIYPYAFETAVVSKSRLMSEWSSPTLPTREVFIEVLLFYITGLYVCYRYFKHLGFKFLFHPVFLTFIFGLSTFRNIIWFFWTFLVHFKEPPFYEVENHKSENLSKIEKAALTILTFVAISLIPPLDRITYSFFERNKIANIQRYHTYTPFHAVEEIIKTQKKGAIFNEFELGSYLIYKLAHQNKIYIDGRNIIYHQRDFENYIKIMTAKGDFVDLLEKYHFQFVLIQNETTGLNNYLKSTTGWTLLYEDQDNVLFEKI